jgi:hypothetical protein
VSGQVGLGQHDHRRDAGLARQRQIAFQPGDVEIEVAGGDDEQRVDIGRDQLQLAAGPGGAPLEQALASSRRFDPQRFRIEQQPVADGRRAFLVFGEKGRDWSLRMRAGEIEALRCTAVTRAAAISLKSSVSSCDVKCGFQPNSASLEGLIVIGPTPVAAMSREPGAALNKTPNAPRTTACGRSGIQPMAEVTDIGLSRETCRDCRFRELIRASTRLSGTPAQSSNPFHFRRSLLSRSECLRPRPKYRCCRRSLQ